MKISKKVGVVLLLVSMILCLGVFFTACLPMTTTQTEGTTTEGGETAVETEQPTGFAGIFAQYGTWIWLAILVVAFYFLLIRPQRMRSKKAQELMSSLQRGDEVVTIGGFHGRIKDIREDAIIITIAAGVDVKVSKSAVSKKSGQPGQQ